MNAGRVLVVDDDPLILDLVRDPLERDGYDVLTALDGEEGLETVRGEHPDVVISDIMMPKMDGFELVRRVRSDPLVGATMLMILSARGDEEDKLRGLELGADDYMTKPFRPTELVARVRAMLRRRDRIRKMTCAPPLGPFATEGMEHLAGHRFDSFVAGSGNRSAYEAARAAAESPGLRFNPLFLFGAPGLGKTHLMCALANEVYERDNRTRALYLTSEVFSGQILDAYRNREIGELRRRYLDSDVLIIDDIQFLAISPSLQSVAAEILSEMYDQGKQIAISSDRRPEHLETLSAEISSGFGLGLVVEMDRPDATLRTKILRFKAARGNWPVEDELLDHLAHTLESDIRTLEGVAKKLVAMKTLQGARLDKGVVDDLVRTVTGREPMPQSPEPRVKIPALRLEAPPTAVETVSAADAGSHRFPNPLVVEFSRDLPVRKVVGLPVGVSEELPRAGARLLVVLGSSRAFVVDTIDALVGRGDRPEALPEGEHWAYAAHLETDDPKWILIGTSRWDPEGALAQSPGGAPPPVFLVVLDSRSPRILDERDLISSVPAESPLAVVVMVSVLTDDSEALSTMLRRLFRVPEQVPIVASESVNTRESRSWVTLALH